MSVDDGYSRLDRLDGLGITEGDDTAPDLSYDEWLIVERFGMDVPEARERMDWSKALCAVTLGVALLALILTGVFL